MSPTSQRSTLRRLIDFIRFLPPYEGPILSGRIDGFAYLIGWIATFAHLALGVGGEPPLIDPVEEEAEASVLELYLGKSGVRQPRPTDGRRPATHAGRSRRRGPRPLHAPALGLEGFRRHRNDAARRPDPLRSDLRLDAGRWTLARAHARSGDRVALAAYLGNSDTFDRAITDFAAAYAEQNDRDHRSPLTVIEQGRLQAQTGI